MMALSIRQPWAWLIVSGHKDIENRSWATTRRGEILIHAGAQLDRAAHDALVAGRHPVTGRPSKLGLLYPANRIELGGIVGMAEIVGCVASSESEWFVGEHGFFDPDREIDTRPPGGAIQGGLL